MPDTRLQHLTSGDLLLFRFSGLGFLGLAAKARLVLLHRVGDLIDLQLRVGNQQRRGVIAIENVIDLLVDVLLETLLLLFQNHVLRLLLLEYIPQMSFYNRIVLRIFVLQNNRPANRKMFLNCLKLFVPKR